jgi:hypothetical protein
MKRLFIVGGLAALGLSASVPASAGPPPKPDLVISSFGLTSWGSCTPGHTVFTFQVTVKNIGAGALPNSEVVVYADDMKSPASAPWDLGQGEDVALAPGATHTFMLKIPYYAANPHFMKSASPHPWRAMVNPKHTIAESSYSNNNAPGPKTWSGIPVIMVAPSGCP